MTPDWALALIAEDDAQRAETARTLDQYADAAAARLLITPVRSIDAMTADLAEARWARTEAALAKLLRSPLSAVEVAFLDDPGQPLFELAAAMRATV